MTYTQTSLPGSQIQFTVSVPKSTIEQHYKSAVSAAVKGFSMDGFRPGHAPEAIVIQKVGTLRLWTDALDQALPDIYLTIITETKVSPIGKPAILVTKIADQSDAELTITTAVLPAITLPDYKSIAKTVYSKKTDTAVSKEELEAKILELRRMRYQSEQPEGAEQKPLTEIAESELPELTDEYATGFGAGIETVAGLREKLEKTMHHDKIHHVEDTLRANMMTEMVKASSVELPSVLIEFEIDKMLSQFEHDMTMSGVTLSQYLEYSNKTMEDMRKELVTPANERALTQMLLDKISIAESIEPNKEAVEAEMAKMNAHYVNTPDYNPESAKSYIEQILGNQAVFAWLESYAGFTSHDHEAMSK
jgi:FKBP-type peptidyl-prolyl cis-trans isomerase (trigger factor)